MILRYSRNSQYSDGTRPIFYRHNFYLTYQKKLVILEMWDHKGQDHSSVDHTDYRPEMKMKRIVMKTQLYYKIFSSYPMHAESLGPFLRMNSKKSCCFFLKKDEFDFFLNIAFRLDFLCVIL